jgi:hypothetical protein
MRRTPLPAGVDFLLLVAVEPEAAEAASKKLDRSPGQIRDAANFFIEEILLARGGDSYRILGGSRETPTPILRKNFFYLCRWIHAAGYENPARPVYLSRLTDAWNDVKTPERRDAYDQSFDARSLRKPPQRSSNRLQRKLSSRSDGLRRSHQRPAGWSRLIGRIFAFVFNSGR